MLKKKISKIKKINTKRIFIILCILCFIGLFVFSFAKSFSDFAFISTSYADRDEEGYGGGESGSHSTGSFGEGESGSHSTGSIK